MAGSLASDVKADAMPIIRMDVRRVKLVMTSAPETLFAIQAHPGKAGNRPRLSSLFRHLPARHAVRFAPHGPSRAVRSASADLTRINARRLRLSGVLGPVGTFGSSKLWPTAKIIAAGSDTSVRADATGSASRSSGAGPQ